MGTLIFCLPKRDANELSMLGSKVLAKCHPLRVEIESVSAVMFDHVSYFIRSSIPNKCALMKFQVKRISMNEFKHLCQNIGARTCLDFE